MKSKRLPLKGDRGLISGCFSDYSGKVPIDIVLLQQSGSDRKYFRVRDSEATYIAVLNDNSDENETFVSFSRHFRSLKLSVPEILAFYPDKNLYFQTDLGDTNLFTWMTEKGSLSGFSNEISLMYSKVLSELVDIQVKTIDGLDLDLCYPHKSFDEQSINWDMNYFKYMFLKLVAVPFNEKRLEKDFETLKGHLLKAGNDFFLYRDFQSANIMMMNDKPWFIDYQGGRSGAPQYDVASLLYDSKAQIPQHNRDLLLEHYLTEFGTKSDYDTGLFRELYPAFVLIRIMQALGAYGYRGLFEKKPGFAQSIVPAIFDVGYILDNSWCGEEFPEIKSIVKAVQRTPKYKSLRSDFERENAGHISKNR